MSKRLIVVGNSLALVIERPLLRALHIKRHTTLEIRTDGVRLIVEPSRVQPPASNAASMVSAPVDPVGGTYLEVAPKSSSLALRREAAQATFYFLEYRILEPQYLEAIGAGKFRLPRTYLRHLIRRETADPVLEMVMDRMEVLKEQMASGKSWTDAIAVAIERVPTVEGAGSLGTAGPDDERRKLGEPVGE